MPHKGKRRSLENHEVPKQLKPTTGELKYLIQSELKLPKPKFANVQSR